ncbi:MAG TPA: hypothetical protein VF677_00820 [Flavobacterium sp.]|jgi:hypothetical protein
MKKVLFALSLVALTAMVSCKDKEKVETETTTVDTTATKTDAPVVEETTTTTSVTVPTFSNDETQKFANDYAKFMEDYMAAAKSNDAEKIKELQAKATEWATKSQGAMSKMTPEDAKKWSEFATSLANAQAAK